MWDELTGGSPESDVMDVLGLDPETYNKFRTLLLDRKTDEIRKRPVEHVFVEYLIQQMGNIGELTKVISDATKDKSHNSRIAAIRVRAELYDRVLDRGKELGMFKLRPDGALNRGMSGIDESMLAELSVSEIKIKFASAVRETVKMMKEFGEHTILESSPGELHYGDPLKPESEGVSDDGGVIFAPRSKADAPAKPSKTARAKGSKHSSKARGRRRFE